MPRILPAPTDNSGRTRVAAVTELEWTGVGTGIGSLPGTDPAEAVRIILGELPELPHLPELPARGPGADLVGRTAGLLVDLPVQTTASGWRLGARSGRDSGRAVGYLSADFDAIEEAAAGYS